MAVTKADPSTTCRPAGSLALVRTVITRWGPVEAALFTQLAPLQVETYLTRQVDALQTIEVLSGAERDQLLAGLRRARPAPTRVERGAARMMVPGAGVFEILSTVFPGPRSDVWNALETAMVTAGSALGGLIAGPTGAALGAELALHAWPEWVGPALT